MRIRSILTKMLRWFNRDRDHDYPIIVSWEDRKGIVNWLLESGQANDVVVTLDRYGNAVIRYRYIIGQKKELTWHSN